MSEDEKSLSDVLKLLENVPVECIALTREQTAELLQVPGDTVENLHRTHKLKATFVGKHRRWRLTDVQEFLMDGGCNGNAK